MDCEKEVEHLRELMAANDLRYEQRFRSSEEAVRKAEQAAEKRFESVNEFRAALSDQQRDLMPRPEAEVLLRSLTEKYDTLVKGRSENVGMKNGWAYAIAAIGVVVAILAILTRNH